MRQIELLRYRFSLSLGLSFPGRAFEMAEVLALFPCVIFALVLSPVNSDALSLPTHRPQAVIDSCTADCLRKVSIGSNSIGNAESCSRGCRLFMIANLLSDNQESDQNSSRHSCKEMCRESYGIDNSEVFSCENGCDLSTVQHIQVPVLAEFSWSLFTDNGNSFQILQGDTQETDDVLTDPGLRSQVTRLETLRLPQVSLRTLPVQRGSEEVVGCGGLRDLPYSYCLLWSLLLLLLLFVLWSCLSLAELPPHHLLPQDKLPLA